MACTSPSKRVVWIFTLLGLCIIQLITLRTPKSFCYSVPLFAIVISCAVIVWWRRQNEFLCDCALTLAHTTTLALFGCSFWDLRDSTSHPVPFPCFGPAMQLLCCQMALPVHFQVLPLTASIVIPATAFPNDFIHPLPLFLMICSVVLTLIETAVSINVNAVERTVSGLSVAEPGNLFSTLGGSFGQSSVVPSHSISSLFLARQARHPFIHWFLQRFQRERSPPPPVPEGDMGFGACIVPMQLAKSEASISDNYGAKCQGVVVQAESLTTLDIPCSPSSPNPLDDERVQGQRRSSGTAGAGWPSRESGSPLSTISNPLAYLQGCQRSILDANRTLAHCVVVGEVPERCQPSVSVPQRTSQMASSTGKYVAITSNSGPNSLGLQPTRKEGTATDAVRTDKGKAPQMPTIESERTPAKARCSSENALCDPVQSARLKCLYEHSLKAKQLSPHVIKTQGLFAAPSQEDYEFPNPQKPVETTSVVEHPNSRPVDLCNVSPLLSRHPLHRTTKDAGDHPSSNPTQQEMRVRRWMMPNSTDEEFPSSLLEPLPPVDRSESNSDNSATDLSHAMDNRSCISNISHDMRTPLTTAISSLEIMMDPNVKLSLDDYQDMMQKMWCALQNALLMVNNVLDYSKLRSAGVVPQLRPINIRRLCVQVLRSLEIQAKCNNVELLLTAESALPTFVLCDRLLLHRVLLNLIAYAVRASPAFGRVHLKVQWDSDRNYLRVAVHHGGRMSPNEQASLFRPISEAGYGHGGVGLSLAVCGQLISEMGGSVSTHLDEEGIVIRFEISVSFAKMVARGNAEPAIIIDSDPSSYHALSEMLQYVGLTVLARGAIVPSSAIAFVSAHEPQLPSILQEMKTKSSNVCLVVPNTSSVTPEQTDAVEALLRSPIDVHELRSVIRSFSSYEEIQSPASSQFSRHHVPAHSHVGIRGGGGGGCGSTSILASVSTVDHPLVLLVEDNLINHKLFVKHLELVGISKVHSAYNGEEAVQLALKNRYALIIMDCSMPVMDGYEATKAIRSIAHHSSTPIVALTANQSAENVQRCRECGMNDFFTKPVSQQCWQTIAGIAKKREKLLACFE